MAEASFDVVVVGAGIMGAAAAAELAQGGLSICLLEQFDVHHNRGSSHGHARIFRLAYEEAEYVELARDARAMWLRLESEAGQELLRPGGAIDVGPPALLAPIEAATSSVGATVERLCAQDVQDRNGGLALPDGWEVLYQPDGGTLWARRCLDAFLDRARRHGASLEMNQHVQRIDVRAGSVAVETPERTLRAESVILTAGAWSAELLQPLGIEVPIRVTREHVAFYPSIGTASLSPFIWHSEGGRPQLYGLSNLSDLTIKIGHHVAGVEVVAGGDTAPVAEEVDRVTAFVKTHSRGVGPDPMLAETCLYASTPDDDFILDRVGRVVVGAGFGGHGFKFAPVIGRMLADLVEGGSAPERFSLSRFAGSAAHAG